MSLKLGKVVRARIHYLREMGAHVPDDTFLDWLRQMHRFDFASPGTPITISAQRQEVLETLQLDGDRPSDPLDRELARIGNSMKAMAPSLERFDVQFGTVSDKRIDARTFRRKDGSVAIVLNQSIPLLMSRLTKLRIATETPTAITHCNRGDPNELTSGDYRSMAREVMSAYATSFEVRGPYLELADGYDSVRSLALMGAEAFLIAHELGHLAITALSDNDLGLESTDDDIETAADHLAARMMWNFMVTVAPTHILRTTIPLGLFRLCEISSIHASSHGKYRSPLERAYIALRPGFDGQALRRVFEAEYAHGAWFLRDDSRYAVPADPDGPDSPATGEVPKAPGGR